MARKRSPSGMRRLGIAANRRVIENSSGSSLLVSSTGSVIVVMSTRVHPSRAQHGRGIHAEREHRLPAHEPCASDRSTVPTDAPLGSSDLGGAIAVEGGNRRRSRADSSLPRVRVRRCVNQQHRRLYCGGSKHKVGIRLEHATLRLGALDWVRYRQQVCVGLACSAPPHASITTRHAGCDARNSSTFARVSFRRSTGAPSAVAPCT